MSVATVQKKARDINTWAVDVMRGVGRVLRKEGAAAKPAERLPAEPRQKLKRAA
jgi:hypothetical protein